MKHSYQLILISISFVAISLIISGFASAVNLGKNSNLKTLLAEIKLHENSIDKYYKNHGYFPGTNNGTTDEQWMNITSSIKIWEDLHDKSCSKFNPHRSGEFDRAFGKNKYIPTSKNELVHYAFGIPDETYTKSLILFGGADFKDTNMVYGAKHAFEPKDAKILDTKIDDGLPDSGKIYVVSFDGDYTKRFEKKDEACGEMVIFQREYNTKNNNKVCSLAYSLANN